MKVPWCGHDSDYDDRTFVAHAHSALMSGAPERRLGCPAWKGPASGNEDALFAGTYSDDSATICLGVGERSSECLGGAGAGHLSARIGLQATADRLRLVNIQNH